MRWREQQQHLPSRIVVRKFMNEVRGVPSIDSVLLNVDDRYVPGCKGFVPVGYMTIFQGA